MYNLHCHSLLSDGVLLPSEVAARYLAAGYKGIAITDHADYSNIEVVIKGIIEFVKYWPVHSKIKILPGIELTHVPPEQFKPLAKYARENGIKIIVAHGETIVEPVAIGTNHAALEADIDILAHPGLISDDDIRLAKLRNIFLEITARKGHRDANTHIVERVRQLDADMVLNTDGHAPEDIISPEKLISFGINAGLSIEEVEKIDYKVESFFKRLLTVGKKEII